MKFLFTFFLSLSFLSSFTQDKNQFYALDAKMNQTVLDSSKYILWIHETDRAKWQWDYYLTWGPLVKSTRYADHDGTIKDGRFSFYNSMGDLDSTGVYDHGKKNGRFLKMKAISNDSMITVLQYDYLQDSLVKSDDSVEGPGKITKDDTSNKKEAAYPGGISQWTNYIVKNMRYPERAQTKDIQGEVRIYFRVDKDGNVSDPFIQKSIEYSLDEESLRLIKQSGKWEPATINGVPADSYKIQPLNYRLETR